MSLRDFLFNNILQGQQGPQEHNPQLMAAAQQQMPMMPQSQNPLDVGSSSAIRAVRESMSSKPQTQMGMMGRITNTLGRALSNVGLARLRSSESPMARQLGGMYQTPQEMDAIEDARQRDEFDQNIKIMNYIAQQEARDRQEAYRNEVLNERKRHHNLIEGRRSGNAQKIISEPGLEVAKLSSGEIVDVSGYTPITNKTELNRISKSKRLYANTLHSVNESMRHVNELEKITEDSLIKPTDPYLGSVSRKMSDIGASMGNKNSVKVRNKTKILNDSLTSIRTAIEQAKKGGVPGEQMMKRWEKEGILPHLHDSIPTIKEKLQTIHDELDTFREADDLSLKFKRNIDPVDLDELRRAAREKPKAEKPADSGMLKSIKSVAPGLSEEAIREAMRLESEQ